MGLFDLLKEEPKDEVSQEEIKEAEVIEKKTKNSKKTVSKENGTKSTKQKKTEKGHVYPFALYTEGRLIDISNYGFEDKKAYTENEITKIMLAHKHYEFAGTIEYNFIKEDNVLVANAKQHKKG